MWTLHEFLNDVKSFTVEVVHMHNWHYVCGLK